MKKKITVGEKEIYLDMFDTALNSLRDELYLVEAEKEARSVGLGTGEKFLEPSEIDNFCNRAYQYLQYWYYI